MKCGIITLNQSTIGTDNFNICSDVDGFTTPFETGISRAALVTGFTSYSIPSGTTIVRAISNAECTNYVDATIQVSPTPTSTPSVTPSSTPAVSPTSTPSVTPSSTPAVTPSVTPTRTPSVTPTRTPSVSPTPTNSPPVPTPSATPVGQYCYIGFWTNPDPAHPNGGSVQYTDYTGTHTQQFIWDDTFVVINALTILATVGVSPEVCP